MPAGWPEAPHAEQDENAFSGRTAAVTGPASVYLDAPLLTLDRIKFFKVNVLADLHRRCREEARRARHEAPERAVRDAVASLVREGLYPSAKRVFDRAGLGPGLSNPRLKAVWRHAQRSAGLVLP